MLTHVNEDVKSQAELSLQVSFTRVCVLKKANDRFSSCFDRYVIEAVVRECSIMSSLYYVNDIRSVTDISNIRSYVDNKN